MDIKGSSKMKNDATGIEPIFVEKDEVKIVGMRCNADITDKSSIPKLWDDFLGRMNEIKNKVDGSCFGVCIDNDDGSGKFSYIAGNPVKNHRGIPKGMIKFTIPGSRYAVFTHRGKLDRLDDSYKFIYQEWLPSSGKKLNTDGNVFELYDVRFTGDENSEFDIYVPIE